MERVPSQVGVNAMRGFCGKSLVGIGLMLGVAGLSGLDCPPGSFDYGPVLRDDEIVAIVLDHYGASDPLTVAIADYERAAADVANIRTLFPELRQEHSPLWVTNAIVIDTSIPDDPDLLCLNTYFAATMVEADAVWLVFFPHPVNVHAMADLYSSLRVAAEALSEGAGCAGTCCESTWTYTVLDEGVWLWHLDIGIAVHHACVQKHWEISTTPEGAVTLEPDFDGDGSISAVDLGLLLGAWGECAYLCPFDLDGDDTVGSADLAILLGKWS